MKLAQEEYQSASNLKNDGTHLDKKILEDAWRHYNEIRKRYHTKRAEIANNTLRIVEQWAFPFWNELSGENSAFLNIKLTYTVYKVKAMEQISYLKGAPKATMSFGYVIIDKVATSSKD